MSSDNRPVFLKQFCHLSLSKPHGLILQLYIKLGLAIIALVYNNLVVEFVCFHICHYEFKCKGTTRTLQIGVHLYIFCLMLKKAHPCINSKRFQTAPRRSRNRQSYRRYTLCGDLRNL